MVAMYMVFAALGATAVRLNAPLIASAACAMMVIAVIVGLLSGFAVLPTLAMAFLAVGAFQVGYVISVAIAANARRAQSG